jgi:hypothetical protein
LKGIRYCGTIYHLPIGTHWSTCNCLVREERIPTIWSKSPFCS